MRGSDPFDRLTDGEDDGLRRDDEPVSSTH